jgi:C_GCAxxG_C_C family probable redox protein
MNKAETVVACFKEGFACSQAILVAYAQAFGMDRETALRVAGGFGGGMGGMGEACGAVTGAFMVLGLKYGRTDSADKAAKAKTYAAVQKFANRFKARHGSILCRDLIGCDLSTPAGVQAAREKNLFATVCVDMVRSAAEILEEIL